jgi:PPOX class probable F420-dependent enzyme
VNPLAMTRAEREAFLAEPHVGVLAVARTDGHAPLATPVWYEYEPGGDVLVTVARASEKARRLAASPAASLTVQSEAQPYRFVTVFGPARLEPAENDLRRRIAARYLPDELVEGYLASVEPVDEMVTVRLTTASWRSNDYGR